MKRFYNIQIMEDLKRNTATDVDKEIVFSKAIKAGKRIYYLDVKKNRKGEMFLAITESKKVVSAEGNSPQVSFEKHKYFIQGRLREVLNRASGNYSVYRM